MVMMMMVMTMMRMRMVMVMVIMFMCRDGGRVGAKSISCQHLPANPRGQVTNEMFSLESKGLNN